MFFINILAMLPERKEVDKSTMNYSVVINCGIWILEIVYVYVYKKREYSGAKSNLDEMDYLGAINVPLRAITLTLCWRRLSLH
jgi:hypothetical protein